MKVKIRNIDTDWSAWVPEDAIERSVPCNGPHGCFALMPEDWPADDTDRNEVLSRLDNEPELNMWYAITAEASPAGQATPADARRSRAR